MKRNLKKKDIHILVVTTVNSVRHGTSAHLPYLFDGESAQDGT